MGVPRKHLVNFFFADFGKIKYYAIANELIGWLNKCFDKTTDRLFICGNLHLNVPDFPHIGSAFSLPSAKFPINVYIVHQEDLPDREGSHAYTPDGAGIVVVRRKLDGMPLPLPLDFKNTVLHETGHCFGCAIGEYYSVKMVSDLTGVDPQLKVSLLLPKDGYWSMPQRFDWRSDVMLNTFAVDPKWCPLSSLVIRWGIWRLSGPPTPDLDTVQGKCPVSYAKVTIYRASQSNPELLYTTTSDQDGLFTFPWGGNHDTAISNDQMRKMVISNASGAIARGLSIFDVQQAWLSACEKAGTVGSPSMASTPYAAVV